MFIWTDFLDSNRHGLYNIYACKGRKVMRTVNGITVSHYPEKGVVWMMSTNDILTLFLVLIAFADLIVRICKRK